MTNDTEIKVKPMDAESSAEKQSHDVPVDNEESTFDIPRPALSLQQAASILGKSLRSLERSIMGRWGNKLPDGWTAKKVDTGNGQEWRIIPPPGFRLRQVHKQEQDGSMVLEEDDETLTSVQALDILKSQLPKRKLPWRPENQSIDAPSIIIDRGEEVERLLRELVQVQKQLSEERRLRMEDLRLITQMQGSMRLLEVNAAETAKMKDELSLAKQEFVELKNKYLALVNAPFWRRLFGTNK